MNSTWELKEKSTGSLKTTVGGEDWKKAQKKAFAKLAEGVEIKGFRKGQAPEKLVRKQIGTQQILMEAVEHVANDALRAAVDEHKLELVARPTLDFDKIDEEEVTFNFIVAVKPEVKLGDYKELPVKKASTRVTKKEIEEQVAQLQERFADLVVKEEGAVEDGDTAVIDFEGFLEGVPFEGGKGENYPLVIGSNSFIPGFEEQLIGMKSEETKDITVTFPEEYQAADLAGKEVVFKVTVHDIKVRELPEINDELIKEANVEGVETVEAYEAYIKENLSTQKKTNAENDFINELLTKVVDNASMEIPEAMIEEETDMMLQDFAQRLQQQGFGLEQYTQITGQSIEMIRGEMHVDAESKVKGRLVLEEIAKVENLEVSEKEVEAEFTRLAEMYGMEVDTIKPMISSEAVAYDLKTRKALDLVKDTAKGK